MADLSKSLSSLKAKLVEAEQKQPGSFTHHTEKEKRPQRQRFPWSPGPNPKEYGEPADIWNRDPETSKQDMFSPEYRAWQNSEQGKAHTAASRTHMNQQLAAFKKHKQRHGNFDAVLEDFPNPYFDDKAPATDSDDEEPETIDVGVDYDSEWDGEDTPGSWDEPPDRAQLVVDIHRIVDLDTGEDITKIADTEEAERRIEERHPSYADQVRDARDQAAIDRWESERDYNESVEERHLREMIEAFKKKVLSEITATQPGVTIYNGTGVDGYITPQQAKHNIDMVKQGKAKLDKMDHVGAWVQDAANQVSLGFADNLAAGLDSIFHGTKYSDELEKYHGATKAYQDLPGTANLKVDTHVPLVGEINVTPGDIAGLLLGAGIITDIWKLGAKPLAKIGAKVPTKAGSWLGSKTLGFAGGMGTTAVLPGVAHAFTDTDGDGKDDETGQTQQDMQKAQTQQPKTQPTDTQQPNTAQQPAAQKKPYDIGTREQVRALQKVIGAKQDGLYGPETKAKLKIWQQSQNLKPDGVPGPNTYAAMVKYVTGKDPQQAAKDLNAADAKNPDNVAESISYSEDQTLARIIQLSRK